MFCGAGNFSQAGDYISANFIHVRKTFSNYHNIEAHISSQKFKQRKYNFLDVIQK
jgi:hypothetical protein